MDRINSLPLHPKNKVWLYSQYLMSKLSLHLTIADIDQTWIINNLDTLAHNYLRRWLEIPASGTLSIVMLTKSQSGLNIADIGTKFKQCQVVMRQCLKNSCNHDINHLVQVSSDKSKQYDTFNSTKNVVKSIRNNISNKIKGNLTTQGLVIRHVWDSILASTKTAWTSVQKSLPKNIYNFTIRYFNDTLPNMSNMCMWVTQRIRHVSCASTTKVWVTWLQGARVLLRKGDTHGDTIPSSTTLRMHCLDSARRSTRICYPLHPHVS